jgi:hypothetical protein
MAYIGNQPTSGIVSTDNLPTIPTSKGGTGLTSTGTAGQVLKVNSGGTGLEYGAGGGADQATVTETVTSGGILTLTNSSNYLHRLTGTANHTIMLPQGSTLTVGKRFEFHNESTGTVTIKSYNETVITVMPTTTSVVATCKDITVNSPAGWNTYYTGITTAPVYSVAGRTGTISIADLVCNIKPYGLDENLFTATSGGARLPERYLSQCTNCGNINCGTRNCTNVGYEFFIDQSTGKGGIRNLLQPYTSWNCNCQCC